MSVYVVAEVKLRNGMRGEFEAAMPGLLEAFEPYGWRLVDAYTVVFGDLNESFHVWEAADAQAAIGALDSVAASETFGELFVAMRDYTEHEHISLCRKAPYSP